MARLSDHEPYIQHFTHPHSLQLTNPQTLTLTTPCSACQLQPSGWMYTCQPCNFNLHLSCAQIPQFLSHPSHPYHQLTLLPMSPYPSGKFYCDGCGCDGHGFSFHCTHCRNFDVHILCALKPLFLMNHFHPHQLELTFHFPYHFSCNICRQSGSNHWLYRCRSCGFDAHLDCASNVTNVPQPQTQTQTHIQMQHSTNSLPGGYQPPNGNFRPGGVNSFAHSQSTGTSQNPQVGMSGMYNNVNGIFYASTNGNFLYHQSMGTYQNSEVGMPGIVNTAIPGLVQGATQQVGNHFMQNTMNDGSGGGGNGGDPGGDNSSPIMGFLSSLFSGVFDDSS